MKEPSDISLLSQDARIAASSEDVQTVEWLVNETNAVIKMVSNDIQRLATSMGVVDTQFYSSGTHRHAVPTSGIARIWAISDTESVSDGSNYYILTILRNGVAPLSFSYDTRDNEVKAYLGGQYLGELTVSQGDIIEVSIATTGAPSPTLSTGNFSLLYSLREV